MYTGISFPNIDPIALMIGPFAIRWYSLAYIFGLVFAWLLARKMSKRTNSLWTVLKIDDFVVWATVGIIVGGRVGYVLFYNFRYFLEFPIQIFFIWQGGMSFHGGLLGVTVATILFAKKKQIPIFVISDILCCVAPIGLFLGRLANFVNGELFGRVTTAVPWAVIFPAGGEEPRHPSQLYEALGEGVFLFLILNILWWFFPRFRTRRGFLTGLFFVLYAFIRFALESFREPDAHLGFISHHLTMGQLLCIPMFLFGWFAIYQSSPKNVLKKIKEN